MVWWWLSYIWWFGWNHCWDALAFVSRTCQQTEGDLAKTSIISSAKALQRRQQDMPVTDRWMLSTVTLQWNSLLMTAVWVIGPYILSCHLKKQVESLIFLSDMSFHTALNGKIGLFDLNFSVPSKLVCMAAPAQTEGIEQKADWNGQHLKLSASACPFIFSMELKQWDLGYLQYKDHIHSKGFIAAL